MMSEHSPNSAKLVRLQRYLASCGLGSRRACEEFITMGRVTVDGKTVTQLGTSIDPHSQRVALDGEKLKMERKKYYIFNKPPGVLCTNRDPQGRPRVIDYFDKDGPRLFTVGRLDEDSEGLLIVTNDGDLAQKLAHPSFRIFRTYHVLVAGVPTAEMLAELKKGVYFAEGRFKVESAKSIKRKGQSTWVEVILAEGHNREVRRLFARMGHKVMKLQRVAFGPIFLGRMVRGEVREIRRDEMERLLGMIERNETERSERKSRPRPATSKPRPAKPADQVPKADKPPRSEERGFGIGDVSDEEMMGLVDRPRRKSAGSPRSPRPERTQSPRRPDRPLRDRAPSGPRETQGRDSARPGPGRPADGKKKASSQQRSREKMPRESFGRQSPGQPKRKPRRP